MRERKSLIFRSRVYIYIHVYLYILAALAVERLFRLDDGWICKRARRLRK